jgi:nucleoside-diphosphate-sugar epimerase
MNLRDSSRSYKVLITGGAGFIGSHLTKKLIALGHQVTVIDNLNRGRLEHLNTVKDKINFLKKDITKDQDLEKVFEGHDIVFNLAALNTGVDYDLGRTEIMFEENMLLQMMPLRAAGKTKSVKKFVQISSASIYSRKAMEQIVPTPETADDGEPEPSKLGYALAKKMGEYLARWYAENSQLETVCARFINVYGEDDNFDQMGHFMPVMIRKFTLAKDTVEVFGSGNQKRSFLYVGDAVNALLVLADRGENGVAYNVDAGEEHSVREVVELIQRFSGRKGLKTHYDVTKPEGSQRRLLDSAKLMALGWKPEMDFVRGVESTVKNIMKNVNEEQR